MSRRLTKTLFVSAFESHGQLGFRGRLAERGPAASISDERGREQTRNRFPPEFPADELGEEDNDDRRK